MADTQALHSSSDHTYARDDAQVSVVIPCYNASRFLEAALASAVEQTRPALEIILVDDGSLDGSATLAEHFASQHPMVRVLRHTRNIGAAAARNTGLLAARGEVVAFLDADDIWAPEHLEVLVGLLERHPTAMLATTDAQAFGDATYRWEQRVPVGPPVRMFWPAFEYWIVPQNAVAVRVAAAREIGGYDESAHGAEDYEFVLRLAWRWPFVASERITVWYRCHPGQQSAQSAQQHDALRRLRVQFTNRVAAEAAPDDARRMRRFVIRDWWAQVQMAQSPEQQRTLASGPGLRSMTWSEAVIIRVLGRAALVLASPVARLARVAIQPVRRALKQTR